jgi:hypothetical protein
MRLPIAWNELRAKIGEIEPLLTPFARAVLADQERGSKPGTASN